jgi:hypothetical protein
MFLPIRLIAHSEVIHMVAIESHLKKGFILFGM